jgi:hypothetical protein
MAQNILSYDGLATSNYVNLTRDLSFYNSKNYEHSDRDGNVLGYICNVKISSDIQSSIGFWVAPNSWKMRNSFKKWHAYRDLMFSEAGADGLEVGRYGHTIRPYMDFNMKAGTIMDPVGWDLTTQTQEWTYTQIAAAPGFGTGAAGTNTGDIVDTYELHICGANQVDVTTPDTLAQYYTSVGMIHSYNQDRMEVVTPNQDATTVEGQNNPLALLKQGGSVSGGEVMDIVQDQESEKPPYDITDNGWSIYPVPADIMQISPGWDGEDSVASLKSTQLFVPAGLLYISSSTADSNATMIIDVVGIVRCRDME